MIQNQSTGRVQDHISCPKLNYDRLQRTELCKLKAYSSGGSILFHVPLNLPTKQCSGGRESKVDRAGFLLFCSISRVRGNPLSCYPLLGRMNLLKRDKRRGIESKECVVGEKNLLVVNVGARLNNRWKSLSHQIVNQPESEKETKGEKKRREEAAETYGSSKRNAGVALDAEHKAFVQTEGDSSCGTNGLRMDKQRLGSKRNAALDAEHADGQQLAQSGTLDCGWVLNAEHCGVM
ncbi:hypothetical protein V8F20_004612 [Naviculisporaceae sp. PSN 640]